MLNQIIDYSIRHKIVVFLITFGIAGMGIYSLINIPIGAVPDVTNNQVQVITTSRDLAAQDVERFLTYPVELEMANLPGVKEIRSISKFGLSVVTVVFEDAMDTYLPRQLIAEKLKLVEEKIPAGFGVPAMGPISTGLGEIYQYVLDVAPEYKDQYTVTDLRSIQDWIVKRQLSGIPGIVEINTWGGYLKTYEVAVRPADLRAMDISLITVYEALRKNNSIAGGGYIEKSSQAYFIRAEGLIKNIDEIGNIVVQTKNGIPIYVKDVATIGFGAATRFGAITGNGEGEKVLGQVMMLKGANSNKVIQSVKERVADIQSSLPEGVFINPFLERSDLINRTTYTIAENLILGFLIVLFVVVFLLGNFRSGLVVASVIPLTLLFALMLMYFFGVDANLMSLGAIDFGIIIDGAVIIVEYIAYQITKNAGQLVGLTPNEKQIRIDEITSSGTRKMLHSAVFGQIIIIIVFIPILSLTGIEGKMFRPMALTFCFALIGAMCLCFTYVPVMASLFIKPDTRSDRNISTRFINFLKVVYRRVIVVALRLKYVVIAFSIGLLVLTGLVFNRMGGEFAPTLDEGDFVIQPVFKTGMSLAETVVMTTRIEKILLEFPEVNQVVTRIGAAEVPTDPMSMEESDVIITLSPKSEWTSADSKDELADVFKKALLNKIPGIDVEFTQPIEMRFNELITGARADLAIKLFGTDLDILNRKANEIEAAIRNVEGAADITVEKTAGLPQMIVKYDRSKIAKYGLNIADLNGIISMGFAGKSAGIIFEEEQQYDLVLRYDKSDRQQLDDIRNSIVDLPNGMRIPLSDFADIQYTTGPAKISRDDTKRRVVVGVNVRGRDLQSVVDEVSSLIASNVVLPPGYYIDYGGQFENLQEATKRLQVAVPIAMLLIFILLYFAFNSVRKALLIYSAIPLATIGGVMALYLRDMPFSISAGVGFIALFGIAVLNGIVLLEHFNELKLQGMTDIKERVIQGTVDRIRPVLLTAVAAALGFLPMAISTSAGAEVQRPLATVVIGGLFTATILTLVLLPLLYCIFENRKERLKINNTHFASIILLLLIPTLGIGQQELDVQEIIEITKAQNLEIRANQKAVERERKLEEATRQINFTDFYYEYDRSNLARNDRPLHVFGASHIFVPPALHAARADLQKSNTAIQQKSVGLYEYEVIAKVHLLVDDIQYYRALREVYEEIIEIYTSFQETANRKYELGESSVMELLTARQKSEEIILVIQQISSLLEYAYEDLGAIMNYDDDFIIERGAYEKLVFDVNPTPEHPLYDYYLSLIDKEMINKAVVSKELLPKLKVSLFNGINSFSNLHLYPGLQLGVGIPLSKKAYHARIEAAQLEADRYNLNLNASKKLMQRQRDKLSTGLTNINGRIQLYEGVVDRTVSDLIEFSKKALDGGEIDYFQYLLALENAGTMKIKYVDLIHEYNHTIISMNFLMSER